MPLWRPRPRAHRLDRHRARAAPAHRIQEFDRVLGGGLVAGSLVLIGGDPASQVHTHAPGPPRVCRAGRRVLYVSGEESIRQIRLKKQAARPRVREHPGGLEVEVTRFGHGGFHPAEVVVIDSIQTCSAASWLGPRQRQPGAGGHGAADAHGQAHGIPTFLVGT